MKKPTPTQALTLRKTLTTTHTSALALSLPSLLLGSAATFAQDDAPIMLDTMQVEERTVDTNPYAEAGAPYKAKISGDKRHIKPLSETPQTISVLTQTQIKESGDTDLRDVLAAQPGISLGTGENGNAFGDRYVIRGHEARSDVFVDGLRDPGMTTRESFAVEQIEITKGPSSTFAGRGSSGGAINSITKQASSEYDFTKAEGALGTDSYQRYSIDTNKRISDDLAVRANVLFSAEDVPDREPADKERQGIALSGAYQATAKLNLVADYYYLNAEDDPDLGTYIDSTTGKPVDDIAVYLQDQDFVDSEVEAFTFRAGYDINENLRIENATRYGTTDNGYVTTGARGTNRDASDPDAPGADTYSLSTHQGWQEVEYFVNQLNLFADTELAGKTHQLVISAEYSELNVSNGVYDVTNNGTTNCVTAGRRGASAGFCGLNASGKLVANINNLLQRDISKAGKDSDYNVDTLSLSIMDTVEITKDLSVFAGVRLDDFDYSNDVVGRGATEATNWSYSDTLWNGHVGVVYNINDAGNVYFTYSTAANINGGESDVGGTCGYGGLCGSVDIVDQSEPEQVENIELGTKWELYDDKLLATAAIFQITKDDVMEGADYETTGTLNTGKHRVKGLEIGLTGNLTDKLSTQFGASVMDSEILKAFNSDDIGGRLANFADNSLFLQLRYQATPAFSFGATATYSSEVYAGQPDSAAGDYEVPSYTVYDLFANYAFSEKLTARINIGNITDEDYYLAAYRSGAFTYIGDARNAQITLSYEF